jgi:hypothetical protein
MKFQAPMCIKYMGIDTAERVWGQGENEILAPILFGRRNQSRSLRRLTRSAGGLSAKADAGPTGLVGYRHRPGDDTAFPVEGLVEADQLRLFQGMIGQ